MTNDCTFQIADELMFGMKLVIVLCLMSLLALLYSDDVSILRKRVQFDLPITLSLHTIRPFIHMVSQSEWKAVLILTIYLLQQPAVI